MIRRFPLILLAIACLSLAACGGNDAPEGEAEGAAPNPVTGVITDVRSEGIGQVRSFVLTSRGQRYEIHIADDVEYGFDLEHLNEHRISADPVVVEHEERDGRRYALSIEDV